MDPDSFQTADGCPRRRWPRPGAAAAAATALARRTAAGHVTGRSEVVAGRET